jgi:CRP-like cAMP-binding protein
MTQSSYALVMTYSPFLLQRLAKMPYFQGLSSPVLAQLADAAVARSVNAGEILFLAGQPSVGMYLLEQGRVKIYQLNPQGQEHILLFCADNDSFNEVSALDGGVNPANAAALSDCQLWILPTIVFQQALHSDAAFSAQVVKVLARRLRGLVRQVEDLTLYAVTTRVARLLLKQAQDPALSGVGVTRATLAAHIATTPQTISTALRELEQTGAIRFSRHEIQIIDEALLRSIAML